MGPSAGFHPYNHIPEGNTVNIKRYGAIAAVVGATALVLAGCATSNSSGSSDSPSAKPTTETVVGPKVDTSLTGTITAGGSSAQANAETAWTAAFQGTQAKGVVVNYDKSQGSGGGVTNFLSGSYDFAGSDAALNATQYPQAVTLCAGGSPVDIPAYLSGVALIYKLDGVTDLQLSSATVAKIFTLQIKTWDDPAIKADNPKATLPSTPITVVTRSDGSGTTANFTKYMHDTQPSIFTQAVGTAWPVAGTSGQQGGSGVVNAVTAGTGTIGYADQSSIGTATAAKVSGSGKDFVAYTAEGATEAFDSAATVASQGAGDLTEVIDYSKISGKSAYPIPLLSYVITCTVHKDAAQGKLTQAYLGYVLSTQGQLVGSKNAGAAPLPTSVLKAAQKTIALIK
ncbi:MAG TPA: extracellular solute-binding protein [Pseudolysinimonas sp.]|nr:extracellular solute-binding protein [Pseudolysinimonas sp.]